VLKYVMSGVSIELEPEYYVVQTPDNLCKAAFMQIDVPSEYGHAYILGATTFRQIFTVFRRGTHNTPSMIGVAPAVHSMEGVKYLQSLKESS